MIKIINVRILPSRNGHVQYLNNKVLDLMNSGKFGGVFHMGGDKSKEEIILNSMPAHLLKLLKKQKIIYEVISPKENKISKMYKKAVAAVKSASAKFMSFFREA